MTLLISMLPFYLIGNFHCMGMCGPLVMMIGKHRYCYFYFVGRALSFMLAGGLAGGAGSLLYEVLRAYQLPALVSFFFGLLLLLLGFWTLMKWPLPSIGKGAGETLSLLLLKEEAWPTFLFGFFTVFLPCGQTLIVFSAIALSGDFTIGLINGLAFALLTSPSLFLAMHAHFLMQKARAYYNIVMGGMAFVVGGLAICRGLAEVGVIPHLVLSSVWHIVLY